MYMVSLHFCNYILIKQQIFCKKYHSLALAAAEFKIKADAYKKNDNETILPAEHKNDEDDEDYDDDEDDDDDTDDTHDNDNSHIESMHLMYDSKNTNFDKIAESNMFAKGLKNSKRDYKSYRKLMNKKNKAFSKLASAAGMDDFPHLLVNFAQLLIDDAWIDSRLLFASLIFIVTPLEHNADESLIFRGGKHMDSLFFGNTTITFALGGTYNFGLPGQTQYSTIKGDGGISKEQ